MDQTKHAPATPRFTAQELFDAVNADPRVKAYTKLVKALRGVMAHETGIVWLFNVAGEAAPAAFSLACEKARALLREIGEDA